MKRVDPQSAKLEKRLKRQSGKSATPRVPGPANPEQRLRTKPKRSKSPTGTGDASKQPRDTVTFLEQEIERALASDAPIVAGPFLGEVGFELLYWIPLLRWAVERYPALGPRLHVVSRGGTATWYAGLSDSYVDALQLYSAEEFVRRREAFKQRRDSEFDAELLQKVEKELDLGDAAILHPRILWRTYYRTIKNDSRTYSRSVERDEDGSVRGFAARYRRFDRPPRGVLDGVLPDEPYAAVRFYFRPSFPDTPENREWAQGAIAALAQQRPVVLLNNRLELDDHTDLDVDADQPVVTIHEHMTPANNLAVQSIAVSHAEAFYGTYGGLSYLPPHFGRPALGVIDGPLEPRPWHADLAQEIFAAPGWGSLALSTRRDLGDVGSAWAAS